MFRRIRKKDMRIRIEVITFTFYRFNQLTDTLNTNGLNYAYFVQVQTNTVVEQSSRELSY